MAQDALFEFKSWLNIAKPGDSYVYASGIAVMGDISWSLKEDKAWVEKIRLVQRAALAAYQDGQVHLFQKRNGNGFDYIAQRRGR